jgi:RNA-directed DNA polymerase
MQSSSAIVQSAYHIADHYYGKPFADEVGSCARKHLSLMKALSNACTSGNKRKIRGAKAVIFRSYSSKLTCLILSMTCKIPISTLKAYASELNPALDCGEVVHAKALTKSSGFGWRPICSFGPKRRGLQRLLSEIISLQFPPNETDYLTKGRGAERASDQLVIMNSEVGILHFVVADISNFFRSVQVGKISELIDMPEAVVQNSLLINQTLHLSIVGGLPPDTTVKSLTGAAREGLPQGSRASQTIAAIILGRMLSEVSSAQLAVTHGDDIIIGAVSSKGACASKIALSAVLENHPAGPFHLKRLEIVSLQEGFNFLQYRHRYDLLDNVVRRRPSAASYARYHQRSKRAIRRIDLNLKNY